MERVALIGENSNAYVNKLINIWNEGNCAVLIDWKIPFEVAIQMMCDADVHKCYIESNILKSSVNCKNNIEFISYSKDDNSAHLLSDVFYEKFKENYSQEEAVIIYSSGTTGEAKGIILSHFAINTNADAIIDYMNIEKDDCLYFAKPFSHSSTLTGELLVSLKTKIKAVVAPTVVPPRFIFESIQNYKVSIICLNPTLLDLFAKEYKFKKYNIEALKKIYVSGSILNDKILSFSSDALKNVEIFNVYGLSEAGPRVTAQRTTVNKTNSVGIPIKGVEVRVVDDEGNQVEIGETGIVHVNTPSRFIGYVNGKTKFKPIYKDWLNTGDIGYIDSNNELNIVGRIDDVIFVNSHKIYPYSIETLLLQSNDVEECIVLYSEKFGITCIYKKNSKEDIKYQLINLLKNNLAIYEMPSKYICVDNIPKTLNGKVNVNELKKLIR